MTVLVERDASLAGLYQSALGGTAPVLTSVDELEAHFAGVPDEYAVVLGPSVAAAAAYDVAERLRVTRPSLSIVLVRTRVDTAVLVEALRAGVREVVESRDLSSLTVAIQRAYQLWEAMSTDSAEGSTSAIDGKLVTSFATKGGVGKSTVATNVASALAEDGSRVCLVDLDVQSGDVAIMLQILPSTTLGDLADMAGSVDRASVESLLIQHEKNLFVLAAPTRVDVVDRLSPNHVGRVLGVLKKTFDFVVVDTGGSFDDYALHALDLSDVVLLVGTLDIPALKSLKIATETLELLNIPRHKWRLVLNRADEKVGLSPTDFQQTLGVQIDASLPSSREVLASVNAGQVMVHAHPRHPVSQSFRALASSISAAQETLTDGPQHVSEPSSRKSLLRKVRRS